MSDHEDQPVVTEAVELESIVDVDALPSAAAAPNAA